MSTRVRKLLLRRHGSCVVCRSIGAFSSFDDTLLGLLCLACLHDVLSAEKLMIAVGMSHPNGELCCKNP